MDDPVEVDVPETNPITPTESLRRYVEQRYVVEPDGCWRWAGPRASLGYGMARHRGVNFMAHRASYTVHVGEIPEGMVIDHLCHSRSTDCAGGASCPHRRCINPDHLEPVTHKENLRRGMSPTAQLVRSGHCRRGHPREQYRAPSGQCRRCAADAKKRETAEKEATNPALREARLAYYREWRRLRAERRDAA